MRWGRIILVGLVLAFMAHAAWADPVSLTSTFADGTVVTSSFDGVNTYTYQLSNLTGYEQTAFSIPAPAGFYCYPSNAGYHCLGPWVYSGGYAGTSYQATYADAYGTANPSDVSWGTLPTLGAAVPGISEPFGLNLYGGGTPVIEEATITQENLSVGGYSGPYTADVWAPAPGSGTDPTPVTPTPEPLTVELMIFAIGMFTIYKMYVIAMR